MTLAIKVLHVPRSHVVPSPGVAPPPRFAPGRGTTTDLYVKVWIYDWLVAVAPLSRHVTTRITRSMNALSYMSVYVIYLYLW